MGRGTQHPQASMDEADNGIEKEETWMGRVAPSSWMMAIINIQRVNGMQGKAGLGRRNEVE